MTIEGIPLSENAVIATREGKVMSKKEYMKYNQAPDTTFT